MKFFKRPPLDTVRRRFLWWPEKVVRFEYAYRPIPGAEKIRFYPGWYDTGVSGLLHPGHTNQSTRWPPVGVKQERCGGMVAPVVGGMRSLHNEWIWLEYVLEELQVVNHTDRSNTVWRPAEHRKQWNLWHEYY